MSKIAPAIIAPIIGGLMFAAMGTTQGIGFDYAAASEERQQSYLDGVARGFERGFKATAGKSAIIERISANAGADSISVDVRFTEKSVEAATASQIEEFRKFTYTKNCRYFAEKALFDKRITLKMRMRRPSGTALTTFTVNEQSCAPYRKS